MNLKSILLAAACAAFTFTSAQAAFTFTLSEVGNDVVMSGFGDFNTTDLTLNLGGSTDGFVTPSTGEFSTTGSNVDFYTGITSAPTFGTGGVSLADSTTGQGIGYNSSLGPLLSLPQGYISQQPITDSAT